MDLQRSQTKAHRPEVPRSRKSPVHQIRELSAADGNPVGETQSALCNIDACEDWFAYQAMPPEFVGRDAAIIIGLGKQFDNDGVVMSQDLPGILSIAF